MFDEEAFQAIGPALNGAYNLDVTPAGNVSVLDCTLPPDDNLKVQKLDGQGNVLKTMEQHHFDQGMPNHIYDVDLVGSIYQMQANTAGVRIVKYSRR